MNEVLLYLASQYASNKQLMPAAKDVRLGFASDLGYFVQFQYDSIDLATDESPSKERVLLRVLCLRRHQR